MKLRIFTAIVFALISANALAAVPEWTADLNIDELRTHGGDNVLGKIVGGTHSCDSGTTFVLEDEQAHERYDQTFSILLAAQVSGRKVQLWQASCDSSSRPVVSGVRLVE